MDNEIVHLCDEKTKVWCPGCEKRVTVDVFAQCEWPPPGWGDPGGYRDFAVRLRLAICGKDHEEAVMILTQYVDLDYKEDCKVDEDDWDEEQVLYYCEPHEIKYPPFGPEEATSRRSPLRDLHDPDYPYPSSVFKPLWEAERCLDNKMYDSCAVQCRKAIEAICVLKKCRARAMYDKMKELCESGIIDSKLLTWSREIQGLGDRGAHAYRDEVGEEEAKFALEFAAEVARYVFVLNEKYESFKSGGKRQDQKDEDEPDTPEPPWECDPPEEPED